MPCRLARVPGRIARARASPRAWCAQAAPECPRSDTRNARERETRYALLRTSSELPLHRWMIREDDAVDGSTGDAPRLARRPLEPQRQDMVDPCRRRAAQPFLGERRKSMRLRERHVEIAGEDERLARSCKGPNETRGTHELGVCGPRVGVHVADGKCPPLTLEAHDLAATRFAPPIECHRAMLADPHRPRDENRICLTGEGRPNEAVVESRNGAAEPDSERRVPRDIRNGLHLAPGLELRQRPEWKLLQAQEVRTVRSREPHHLLEESPTPRRRRIPVKEVPGPDEQAHYCKRRCASSSQIRPPSPPRTTTSLRRGSRVRARTSSSSRRVFVSARHRRPTAIDEASRFIHCRPASFAAPRFGFRSRSRSTCREPSTSFAAGPTYCTCSGSPRRSSIAWYSGRGCPPCSRR